MVRSRLLRKTKSCSVEDHSLFIAVLLAFICRLTNLPSKWGRLPASEAELAVDCDQQPEGGSFKKLQFKRPRKPHHTQCPMSFPPGDQQQYNILGLPLYWNGEALRALGAFRWTALCSLKETHHGDESEVVKGGLRR